MVATGVRGQTDVRRQKETKRQTDTERTEDSWDRRTDSLRETERTKRWLSPQKLPLTMGEAEASSPSATWEHHNTRGSSLDDG